MASAVLKQPEPNLLAPLTRVPVAPFREQMLELERSGRSSRADVARLLGWFRRPSASKRVVGRYQAIPDTGRVTRVLGLKENRPQQYMSYENGVHLCWALDLDPVDVGV